MPRSIEQKTIDGIEFASQQLPALRAYRLMAKLARTLSSGKATTVFDLMGALDPDTADVFILEALAATTAKHDGKIVSLTSRDAINTVFDGRLEALCGVVAWALEVNFGNFSDAVAGVNQPEQAAAPAAPGAFA